MKYLTTADESKIKKAMDGKPKGSEKVLRVLIGCIIEIPVAELGDGNEVIQQVIDRCQEYGTGEIVDAKIIAGGRAL